MQSRGSPSLLFLLPAMTSNQSLSSLLNPNGVAVVGASQRGGRGTQALVNLKKYGFAGDIFAVNPRYGEVEGCRCVPSIEELPDSVDCLFVAIGADAACDMLERAFVRGIRTAIVIASGFGEGGYGEACAARLQELGEQGMAICGPNCYGVYNVRTGAAATNGQLPEPPVVGSVALISQSGSLATYVCTPLMNDRLVGFSHIVSYGNQIGTSIEDYVDYFIDDADVTTVVAIFEHLRQPRRLLNIALTCTRSTQNDDLLSGRAVNGRPGAGAIPYRCPGQRCDDRVRVPQALWRSPTGEL